MQQVGHHVYVSGIDSLADLCDRLAVEVHRLGWFENKKREEQAKPDPDAGLVQKWDQLSRESCELRASIKRKINELFKDVVATGEYNVLLEPRTFRPSGKTIADVLDEQYSKRADFTFTEEFAAAIGEEICKLRS